MYDVIIIGAGIIGSFIARELTRYNGKILLLDKENDVANGTTKANTALVHAGYDAIEATNMAKFNVAGNKMFDDVCEDLYVPFERPGSLVLGFNDEDRKTIEGLYKRGRENHVPDMEILEREELLKLEPNLGDEVVVGLYAKTGGIVGPWELTIALTENAMDNGCELKLNTEVKNIIKEDNKYIIETNQGKFETRSIINAAGLYADTLNNMVSEEKIEIYPVKGEYFLLDKTAGKLVNRVIFQCPSEDSKGVVVTPTVHGNIIVGPDSVRVEDKDNKKTSQLGLNYVRETAERSVKNIPFNENITNFTGLRATSTTGDFIIGEAKDAKGFINVAGIKSPGLSSAPAIGQYVAELAVDILGDLDLNESFNPKRRKPIVFNDLSDEEKNEIIKKDKTYGNIICRCETITEGEIIDCINRNAGATTVDGVKKRVRPGMGRCQGGFCMPRVMEIISRELNTEMKDVLKGSQGSYIITDKTK